MVSWRLPLTARSGEKSALDLMRDGSTSSQEDKLQPSKIEKSKARTIRFDLKHSIVHPHITLDELSAAEFSRMWITAEEFMASKKEYVSVVRNMMKTCGEFRETDDCCPRGLGKIPKPSLVTIVNLLTTMAKHCEEFKTRDGARRRKRTKQQACFAVLEEQDIQNDEGIKDDQFISEVYAEFSSQSSLEAFHRGLKDQTAMLELLDETDRLLIKKLGSPEKNVLSKQGPRARRRSSARMITGVESMNARRPETASSKDIG